MSPHQSKTGVYVFFCIRAKLIHVFVSELLLLSSLSLLLLLSFAGTFLFSLVTTTILCVDHCVSGVNLCRRRSVAFVHRGKRTQKNAPGIARNIGNVVGERCTFCTESRFLRVWRACVWSARGTTWHTVWRNRKCCPYLGPAWRCHVDSAGSHWAVVRAFNVDKIRGRPKTCPNSSKCSATAPKRWQQQLQYLILIVRSIDNTSVCWLKKTVLY